MFLFLVSIRKTLAAVICSLFESTGRKQVNRDSVGTKRRPQILARMHVCHATRHERSFIISWNSVSGIPWSTARICVDFSVENASWQDQTVPPELLITPRSCIWGEVGNWNGWRRQRPNSLSCVFAYSDLHWQKGCKFASQRNGRKCLAFYCMAVNNVR